MPQFEKTRVSQFIRIDRPLFADTDGSIEIIELSGRQELGCIRIQYDDIQPLIAELTRITTTYNSMKKNDKLQDGEVGA